MVYCKLDILMKMVSCKVTTSENQHGYQDNRGALGDGSRCRVLGPSGVHWGAGRVCRWPGASRGIGASEGIGGS